MNHERFVDFDNSAYIVKGITIYNDESCSNIHTIGRETIKVVVLCKTIVFL